MGERPQSNDAPAKLKRNLKTYKICTVLLIILNLTIGYIWGTTTHSFESQIQEYSTKYPLIDISRNFIDQKDFIVNVQSLREDLNKLVADHPHLSVSLYLEILNSGANIQINPNLAIFPASLSKLPTALVVMKKVERGEWSLTDQLVVLPEDRDENYGTLYGNPVGTRITIEELLKEMLTNSDNTAHKMFLRNTNLNDLVVLVEAIGLDELYNNEGKVSAKEYTRLFRTLYTSSFLQRENSQKILEMLGNSEFDDYLGGGLPQEVTFAHKFGQNREASVYSDAGIVYAGNRVYMISMMVDVGENGKESDASDLMKKASSMIYQYVHSQ